MDLQNTQSIVFEVLQRAASQNAEILKPAEEKLREWEVEPGFYQILYNIMSNHAVDMNVRWIAVLYLKNGVDKYWRKNAPNAIAEGEKQSIKQALLINFQEPVNQIALQLAVLVAKVARNDCPKEWPELYPTLLQNVENANPVIQHRSLLTLHHVVKAISSKRLPGDRRMFQEFAANIYTYILNLWNTFTEAFFGFVMREASLEMATANLEKALLTLRILRKLTIYGFYKPENNQDCMAFLNVVFDRARTSLECRKRLKETCLSEQCEKFIIHLSKILLSVLDTHPLSFINYIKPSLEFAAYYCFTRTGQEYLFERLTIQCFNLMKAILRCAEFRPSKLLEDTKEPETLRAYYIKCDFFQKVTLTEITKELVSHYFILTQEDLELWDADPEVFANDEGGESWKYSLRPSMESFFVSLFQEYRDTLAPILSEMIRNTNAIVSPDDMAGILRKDAVYNAVGLAAYEMYDEVDFDKWFTETLMTELEIKHNNYRVIRRRVSWLIGNWTGIKMSADLRPELYKCVIGLLDPNEDMAVRLTASMALRHAIDDFDFNSEQFRPFIDTLFNLLFTLLKEAKECDTKMHVLNVMTLMIERVGQTIAPHTDILVLYLPPLWAESEEHNMLRCAIVTTLVQIVKVVGTVTPDLYPFLLPVIQLGTDTKQSAIVYLLEDCLELWLTVLENSISMTTEMMQLFNNMPALLEFSSEHLRCCLIITMAQLLLAPEMVLRAHGLEIITICDSIISDMRTEGVIMLTKLVETFIRALPSVGCETVRPIVPRIFEFIHLNEEFPMIMSMYLCIASRVLLAAPEVFTQSLHVYAQRKNVADQTMLDQIMEVWVSRMRYVSQLEQRKLLALAVTNLLTSQSQPILQRFDRIFINILEVLNDVMRTDEGVTYDSLILMEGQSPSHFNVEADCYSETEHHRRKTQLIQTDPVHTIVLKDYLQSQLIALRNQVGTQTYEQLLNMVDADTISQLRDYIAL